MLKTINSKATDHVSGILLSYSQVYFSNKRWLGLVLLLLTFIEPRVGISGLYAILVCQAVSIFFNFDKYSLANGAYTYNALMVGLAAGHNYTFDLSFLGVLTITAVFTFFVTIWMWERLQSVNLPVLSLPFIISIWTMNLGLTNFVGQANALVNVDNTTSMLNANITVVSAFVDRFWLADFVHTYLRSLGGIVFIYNDLAGILILFALLCYSRIAFSLSLFGFSIGYLFYYFIQGDFTQLIYSHIGFNFILTSIALGGFYIVPSTKSYLLLLIAIPLSALVTNALYSIALPFHLPLYSLPFSLVTILVIGGLGRRQKSNGIELVIWQQFSPEQNHYKTMIAKLRFSAQYYFHIALPMMGDSYISQGYAGAITHKEAWQFALDFDKRDDKNSTYSLPGYSTNDYYCYDVPVLAPGKGQVVCVVDHVSDNAIGDSNLIENWGNVVIIKHMEGLYSKLAHLKKGSIKTSVGDWVAQGQIIANCGSSGRSPEPHLHFQMQSTPFVGSHTIPYPMAYYLVKLSEHKYKVRLFSVPQEDETVCNVTPSNLLVNTFNLVPGQTVKWIIYKDDTQIEQIVWSVHVNAQNACYIFCESTKAVAYFVCDEAMFYFTDFHGNESGFLHTFYLFFPRIFLGAYKEAEVSDQLMPKSFLKFPLTWCHDFFAPFFHFSKAQCRVKIEEVDNYISPSSISIRSEISGRILTKEIYNYSALMTVKENGINSVSILKHNHKIDAICVG